MIVINERSLSSIASFNIGFQFLDFIRVILSNRDAELKYKLYSKRVKRLSPGSGVVHMDILEILEILEILAQR